MSTSTETPDPFGYAERLGRLMTRAQAMPPPERRPGGVDPSLVLDLRRQWNAPKRHAETKPVFSGAWAAKLHLIRSKLGTGCTIGLIGQRGSGKTQMATELMKTVTKQGRTALYRTAAELFALIKDTYEDGAKTSELAIVTAHRKASLLIIDELAGRRGTEWEDAILSELIDRRYADLRDTVLLSTQNRERFLAGVGEKIADRMSESGGMIECPPSRSMNRPA